MSYQDQYDTEKEAIELGYLCNKDKCTGWIRSDFDVYFKCNCQAWKYTHHPETSKEDLDLIQQQEEYIEDLYKQYGYMINGYVVLANNKAIFFSKDLKEAQSKLTSTASIKKVTQIQEAENYACDIAYPDY